MMRSSWGKLAAAVAIVCVVQPAHAATLPDAFQEKSWDRLSDRQLSDWGRKALAVDATRWRHGETTHFILHYLSDGELIAHRSESFYAEIREFFGNRQDLLAGQKSQVFAFTEPKDWQAFMRGTGVLYAIGITRGNEFFYLATGEDGRFDFKGKVQAHEMTHLVFNRFFVGQLPLWLNEGIAEYFGQRKTATLAEFRRQMRGSPRYTLDRLFAVKSYPTNPLDVQSFYAESAILVDFLTTTDQRRALLPKFVDAMIRLNNVNNAVTIYGYRNLADFEYAYRFYRAGF
jgi:hypothetical protein